MRLILAAVLKPVDDTRMHEKFAHTLLEDGHDVHICGAPTQSPAHPVDGVHWHPWPYFPDRWWRRLAVQWHFWRCLVRIRPQGLIVHTVELLPLAYFWTLLTHIPLCYDIREHYAANIRHQQVYRGWRKWAAMKAVQTIEKSVGRKVAHFFLAERSYAEELDFLGQRYTVLENTFRKSAYLPLPLPKTQVVSPIRFVMTGTLSEAFGTREAVGFVCRLHQAGHPVSLRLVGHVASEELAIWLKKQCAIYNFIQLESGNPLVTHAQIVAALRQADVSILAYPPNPATHRCLPTKLFEALANGVPMLIQQNEYWENFCAPFQAAIFVDLPTADASATYAALLRNRFYPKGIPDLALWEHEQHPGLLLAARRIFSSTLSEPMPNGRKLR